MMSVYSPVVKRSVVGRLIALGVGLTLSVVITPPSQVTDSPAAVSEHEDSPVGVAARNADFDFVDHELPYAGGYGLVRTAVGARGVGFDFLDRELRYADGYALFWDVSR